MISPWWSITLAVIGAAGVYLIGRKLWIGFAVGVGVQGLWIAYAVTTEQWGFIGSAALFGWMNYLGLRRWLRDKSKEGGDGAQTRTEAATARGEDR